MYRQFKIEPVEHYRSKKRASIFESSDSIVGYVREAYPRTAKEWQQQMLGQGSFARFTGKTFRTIEEWYDFVHANIEEYTTLILSMAREIEDTVDLPKPKSHRRRRTYSEHDGDGIDVDRLRSGQAFWQATQRREVTQSSTCTIIGDATTSGGRDVKTIIWKGAAAVVATRILERAGYRVQLWHVLNAGRSFTNGDDSLIAVQLKKHREPLNVSSIAKVVSGWYFRSVMMPVISADGDNTAGFGFPVPIPERDFHHLTNDTKVRVFSSPNKMAAVEDVRSILKEFS